MLIRYNAAAIQSNHMTLMVSIVYCLIGWSYLHSFRRRFWMFSMFRDSFLLLGELRANVIQLRRQQKKWNEREREREKEKIEPVIWRSKMVGHGSCCPPPVAIRRPFWIRWIITAPLSFHPSLLHQFLFTVNETNFFVSLSLSLSLSLFRSRCVVPYSIKNWNMYSILDHQLLSFQWQMPSSQ